MSQPAQPSRSTACPVAVEPQTVTVPAYAGSLQAAASARIRQLRRNLLEAMRDARTVQRAARAVDQATDASAGFAGAVARAACALCQGWCCSKGGEHAYLDGPSLARIRAARPELDAWGVLRLYTRSVANPAYAGSCVFHGAEGCTLERSLRADLCGRYFCNGLGALMKQAPPPERVVIHAERDGIRRTSPVLDSLGAHAGGEGRSAAGGSPG